MPSPESHFPGTPATAPVRGLWARLRWFVVHNVLHADDSPHRLALGLAIGIWVSLLPIIGLQMVASAALCHPFRANKVVAVSMAWLTNPVTILPLGLPCYWLGCWLLGVPPVSSERFEAVFFPPEGGWWARVVASWTAMVDIFEPLWLGCLLVATAVAVPAYLVSKALITGYRLRRYGSIEVPVQRRGPEVP